MSVCSVAELQRWMFTPQHRGMSGSVFKALIMSVVSLWRPVINLRCCGDRAAGLTAGTQWGRRKWSRERMGWVGKVLQEERED